MGYDAYLYIPKGNKKKDIENQLLLLGYKKNNSSFYIGKDCQYNHCVGVWAMISKYDENSEISFVVWVRSHIIANAFDLDCQNKTLRHFKKYFGAYFVSDYGKNRYFNTDSKSNIRGAENACYLAISNLDNNFSHIGYCLNQFPDETQSDKDLILLNVPSASAVNANVYTSYLCSIIEQYYRETYLGLLCFSDFKESIFKKGNKLSNFEMLKISEGVLTVEQAFISNYSFQNISKISSHFTAFNKDIDIAGVLKKPYKGRKETLYNAINRLFEHRHGMIHELNCKIDYKKENILKDIDSVKEACVRSYQHFCDQHNWEIQEIFI